MSNEPMLQRFAAHSPAAEPRSDAETMQAALLRMKAAARQPEAIERLRAELDEMREVIANVRAALLSDSDPSALLDDLDARTGRVMAAVIGGTLPAARPAAAPPAEEPEAATPAEESSRAEELSPAQNFSPAEAFSPGDEPPTLPSDEQTLLDALRDDPAAETAQAPQAEAAPQAESDHVPTVSEVFSQLGLPHADGPGAQSDSTPAGGTTTVAMLELMVEELTAAMPARPAPEEIAETTSLPEPEPAEAAATPNAVVSEPEPIAAAEAPPSPEPVPETIAFTPDEPITMTEVSAFPEPVAVTEASAPQEPTSTAEQDPVLTAETAAPFESKMPEVELLASFARMETMPFLPPEVGTAVIFESRVKSDTTAEGLSAQQDDPPAATSVEPQPAALPEPKVIMPPVDLFEPSEPETSPQPDTPPEQTLQASAAPAPEPSAGPPPPEPVAELDLHVLLFETQFEADDPAATLLEPAWPAQDWPAQDWPAQDWPAQDAGSAAPASAPAAAAQPAAQQPQDKPADPLGPLKAMSDEEKIALFE